jgi:hypothetical protein
MSLSLCYVYDAMNENNINLKCPAFAWIYYGNIYIRVLMSRLILDLLPANRIGLGVCTRT